jgi:hypothetical protein
MMAGSMLYLRMTTLMCCSGPWLFWHPATRKRKLRRIRKNREVVFIYTGSERRRKKKLHLGLKSLELSSFLF